MAQAHEAGPHIEAELDNRVRGRDPEGRLF